MKIKGYEFTKVGDFLIHFIKITYPLILRMIKKSYKRNTKRSWNWESNESFVAG